MALRTGLIRIVALILVATTLLALPNPSSAFGADTPNPPPAELGKKPAYIVIEGRITDPAKFAPYARSVPSLVREFGGEYLVLGGRHEPLEGEWGETRLVLHRWPDAESARKFWESKEYAEAKKLREGSGEFRIMMLEGLEEDDVREV